MFFSLFIPKIILPLYSYIQVYRVYSLFGPYTRFSMEDSVPRRRVCNLRFQLGASSSQEESASVSRKSSLLTCITSLQAAIVHWGYGLSTNSRSEAASTYPSFTTRKYHPVRPLFCIRSAKSRTRKRRAGFQHGCRGCD